MAHAASISVLFAQPIAFPEMILVPGMSKYVQIFKISQTKNTNSHILIFDKLLHNLFPL